MTKPPYSSASDRGASRTEVFKAATTAAVKAISHRADLAVAFTPLAANQKAPPGSQSDLRLPMPPHKLTPDNVVRLRGAADALALRLRHHNDALHVRRMPVNKDAVAAYNAMEQARVEVLGARQYQGVNHNLAGALEQRLTLEGYQAARSYYQVDMADALRVLGEQLHLQRCSSACDRAGSLRGEAEIPPASPSKPLSHLKFPSFPLSDPFGVYRSGILSPPWLNQSHINPS